MTPRRSLALAAMLAGLIASLPRVLAAPQRAVRLNMPALQSVVGRPPAPLSPEERDDLAVLRWLQRYRTPEQVADTWLLLDRNLALFSPALGVDLSKSAPALLRGLRPFLSQVDEASSQLKLEAKRARPYLSNPDQQPCLPPEKGYSFPSGHATWYAAAAELLAALVPERRERLLQVGSHGGASRVMCGVHYPTDVEAGLRLGRAAAVQIQETAQWQAFRSDSNVQAELQQLKAVSPGSLPYLVR